MSFFSYALGALILVLVLLRQVRVRPVPRVFQPRLPVVIGVIGLFEMFSYAGNHHVSSMPGCGCWARWSSAPSASVCCVAFPCGSGRETAGCCARAMPSRWRCGSCPCWCTSSVTTGRATPGRPGSRGRASCSTWASRCACSTTWSTAAPCRCGPSSVPMRAGPWRCSSCRRPVRSSPASMGRPAGRRGGGAGPGQVGQAPSGQGARSRYADDPNIIDAEVVEDDDDHGPPELHAPR